MSVFDYFFAVLRGFFDRQTVRMMVLDLGGLLLIAFICSMLVFGQEKTFSTIAGLF